MELKKDMNREKFDNIYSSYIKKIFNDIMKLYEEDENKEDENYEYESNEVYLCSRVLDDIRTIIKISISVFNDTVNFYLHFDYEDLSSIFMITKNLNQRSKHEIFELFVSFWYNYIRGLNKVKYDLMLQEFIIEKLEEDYHINDGNSYENSDILDSIIEDKDLECIICYNNTTRYTKCCKKSYCIRCFISNKKINNNKKCPNCRFEK
jgi:hypothetical protein